MRLRFRRRFPEIKLVVRSIHELREGLLKSLGEELGKPYTNLAVFPIHARDMHPLVKRRWLKPVSSYFSRGTLARFSPESLRLSTFHGDLLGLADDIAPYGWIYRSDIVPSEPKPGLSWDGFEKQLRAWRKRSRRAVLRAQAGGPTQRYGFLLALLGSNGCSFEEGLERMLARPGALMEAYEWARHMVSEGLLNYPASIYKEKPGSFELFKEGELLSLLAFPGGLGRWPKALQERIRMQSFPRGPQGEDFSTPFNGSIWCVPHNTSSLDVAYHLLAELVRPRHVRALELNGGREFPAQRKLWQDASVLERSPIYRDASAMMSSATAYSADFLDVDLQKLEETFRQALQKNETGKQWLERLNRERHRLALHNVSHQIVRKAMGYIEDRLETIQSVQEVGRSVDRHADYLNRLFQKELGKSCSAYLGSRRMERARLLLGDATLGIKEIAFRLGFSSASTFSRAFQRYWRCTALVMRRRELTRIHKGISNRNISP